MMLKEQYQSILNLSTAEAMGKIAVLYGGLSAEREISLQSGEAIYQALLEAGLDAVLIDVDENFLQTVLAKSFDYAFIALHGRGGEDGVIQAILEWQNIPYVGSGVCASAIAMDKIRTKELWQAHNLPVLPQMILTEGFDPQEVIAKVGLPMAVKPALEGSSNGVSKVETAEQLVAAYEMAAKHDSVIMAEFWVEGEEYTASIIGDKVLPIIHIRVDQGIYDYETKYITGATEYRCPSGLPEAQENAIKAMVKKSAAVIGVKDWARVDIMIDKQQQPWLIEINTVPGMTENSLVPKSAKEMGLSFTETVLTILQKSWESNHA